MGTFACSPACLPHLAPSENDSQHGGRVRALVDVLNYLRALPATGRSYVLHGKTLPGRRPHPTIGVPRASDLGFEAGRRLDFAEPSVGEVTRDGVRGTFPGLREEGCLTDSRALTQYPIERCTNRRIGTVVSRPILSVSAGQQIEPYGVWSLKRRSRNRSRQIAESLRPVPAAMSRSSLR